MRGLFGLAVAAATGLVSQALARPLIAVAGTKEDIIITAENTINGTVPVTDAAPASNPLTLSLVNNMGGDQVYVYVTGRDSNDAAVIVTADAQFYYPDPAGSTTNVQIPETANVAIPLGAQGTTTEVTIPDFISSSRVWVSVGQLTFYTNVAADGRISLVEPSFTNTADPSATINWGFIEFTNNEGGIYANISFVDFIGLVMSMRLTLGSGEVQTVQGLEPGSLEVICEGLKAQTALDGQPWDQMCVTREDGTPLRILAPNMYLSANAGAMGDYYTDYIDQVWAKYTNEDLTVDTQGQWGQVACRVSGDTMNCAGDDQAYPKPTVVDVLGCNSGPFANEGSEIHKAILARMCAAFHRTELLLDGGNVTPSLGSSSYYTVDPTSHYSRLIHEHETDGKGYAFSYDDVNISGENQAGVVAGLNPQVLEIFVGGGLEV